MGGVNRQARQIEGVFIHTVPSDHLKFKRIHLQDGMQVESVAEGGINVPRCQRSIGSCDWGGC